MGKGDAEKAEEEEFTQRLKEKQIVQRLKEKMAGNEENLNETDLTNLRPEDILELKQFAVTLVNPNQKLKKFIGKIFKIEEENDKTHHASYWVLKELVSIKPSVKPKQIVSGQRYFFVPSNISESRNLKDVIRATIESTVTDSVTKVILRMYNKTEEELQRISATFDKTDNNYSIDGVKYNIYSSLIVSYSSILITGDDNRNRPFKVGDKVRINERDQDFATITQIQQTIYPHSAQIQYQFVKIILQQEKQISSQDEGLSLMRHVDDKAATPEATPEATPAAEAEAEAAKAAAAAKAAEAADLAAAAAAPEKAANPAPVPAAATPEATPAAEDEAAAAAADGSQALSTPAAAALPAVSSNTPQAGAAAGLEIKRGQSYFIKLQESEIKKLDNKSTGIPNISWTCDRDSCIDIKVTVTDISYERSNRTMVIYFDLLYYIENDKIVKTYKLNEFLFRQLLQDAKFIVFKPRAQGDTYSINIPKELLEDLRTKDIGEIPEDKWKCKDDCVKVAIQIKQISETDLGKFIHFYIYKDGETKDENKLSNRTGTKSFVLLENLFDNVVPDYLRVMLGGSNLRKNKQKSFSSAKNKNLKRTRRRRQH